MRERRLLPRGRDIQIRHRRDERRERPRRRLRPKVVREGGVDEAHELQRGAAAPRQLEWTVEDVAKEDIRGGVWLEEAA